MSSSMVDLALSHPILSFLLTTLLALSAYLIRRVFILPYQNPLYNLPGPDTESYIWGNLFKFFKAKPGETTREFVNDYGSTTFRYFGFLGTVRFQSIDPTCINHILNNSYTYPKPAETRNFLNGMLGEGLLSAEGDVHKRQRRIMVPSFAPSTLKPLMPVFMEKASQLRDKILETSLLPSAIPAAPAAVASSIGGEDEKAAAAADTASEAAQDGADGGGGGGVVDVMALLGRAAMDIIGVAGFDYDFNGLRQTDNELATAFRSMFNSFGGFGKLTILQRLLPKVLKPLIRTEEVKKTEHCLAVMDKFGKKIIAEKKALILAGTSGEGGLVEKDSFVDRDLLSLLLRANLAKDLPESQKLSDKEVRAQISTFMLAGFETSSTALTWMFMILADRPDIQEKLRKELLTLDESPSLEELNSLSYLEAFVKEGLRLYPPVATTIRTAVQDDVVPLSKPIMGRDGKLMENVLIKKGTVVLIPIININTSTSYFGEDALEFKPERWLSSKAPQDESNSLDVPYGAQATFIGGPRSCIGYRFALLEIKTILFTLLRSLSFQHLSPRPEFEGKQTVVMRPRIVGKEKEGAQMPLLVREVGLI